MGALVTEGDKCFSASEWVCTVGMDDAEGGLPELPEPKHVELTVSAFQRTVCRAS